MSSKPEQHRIKYYDWIEVRPYIEEILGYDVRDTLGKFKPYTNDSVEYRDYWHFLCDTYEIFNGKIIYICDEDLSHEKPWQREITDLLIKEFGKKDQFGFNGFHLITWW
jgi:hypothetical protein